MDTAADRVYDARRAATVAYVASGAGLATVRVASDRVGRFALAHHSPARDVAAGHGRVYVATDADVLAGPDGFESLGFDRSAVAVTTTDAGVLAADEAGSVYRSRDGAWTELGRVGEVRALSGEFVAASDGVSRVAGDGLADGGLADVRDVAAGGAPLAATGDGLYRLGNGWLRERDGAFEMVAAAGGDDRAHAATAETLYARGDGGWNPVDLPVAGPVADVAYGECVYAVTPAGEFLVAVAADRTADGAGGWRSRALGLPDVAAVAVA